MKKIYFLISVLLIIGCKTKSTSVKTESSSMAKTEKTICPENGECTVKALANKKIEIKEDGIGKIYPEITKGENIVIHFNFLRKAPEGVADGNYSEEVYFEIPKSQMELKKEGTSLKDLKMIFGRHYFSPDAGFFLINKGNVFLKRSGEKIQFELEFEMENGQQILDRISETVIIE